MAKKRKEEKPSDKSPALIPIEHIQGFADKVFNQKFGVATTPSGRITISNVDNLTPTEINCLKDVFLETYGQGLSDTSARRAAGISLSVLNEWKQEESFLSAYETARVEGTDYLEDLAFVRAHQNDSVLMKLLEARKPDIYKPQRGGGAGNIKVVVNQLFANDTTPPTQVTIESHSDES